MLETVDGRPFRDFPDAARELLGALRERSGFALWLVARKRAEDWVVLDVEDRHYGIAVGALPDWMEPLARYLLLQRSAVFCPDLGAVPALREALKALPEVGALAAVLLRDAQGGVMGVLCGLDPRPCDADLDAELPQLRLIARLLASLFRQDLDLQSALRRAERAELDALLDPLTSLYNLRGWEKLLTLEEARCARYGQAAGVVAIDLDGLARINEERGHAAGDQLIVQAAGVIRQTSRESDVPVRLGGGEFALLVMDVNEAELASYTQRLSAALRTAGLGAACGFAVRHPNHGLRQALHEAQQRMLQAKHARRATRSGARAG